MVLVELPDQVLPGAAGAVVVVGLLSVVASAVQYVPDGERRVLTADGEIQRVLEPGVHLVVPLVSTTRAVDVTPQRLTASVRGVPTADGVPVDVAAVVEFQVTDPEAAVERVDDPAGRFLEDVEIVLTEGVGEAPVNELQGDPDGFASDVRTQLSREAGAYGIAVEDASVDSLSPSEGE